jgi:hypothetical protein
MRRSASFLAVLGLALLAPAGVASATPTVTLKAAFVPIQGYPGTGNILGAGTAVKAEYVISGNEYGGSLPPLIGVNVFLPAGMVLHPYGFPTCPIESLKKAGSCSKKSQAGPVGQALGVVSFGETRAPEEFTVQPYFAPNGGLELYVEGKSPTLIELISKGHYVPAGGAFGEELVSEVPLVETVQGAADASLERITVEVGSAYTVSASAIYYATVPTTCPKAGFPIKTELSFAGLGGLSPRTVATESQAPCPVGSSAEAPVPETTVPDTRGVVTAPSNKLCLSHRNFTIHVLQLRDLTYRQVSVYVNGRRVNVVRGSRIGAPVDLHGLPKGRYTVRITVTTNTGRRITGTRAYRTCAPKPLPPGANPPL